MVPELMILIILQIENLLSNNFFNLEVDYINEGNENDDNNEEDEENEEEEKPKNESKKVDNENEEIADNNDN